MNLFMKRMKTIETSTIIDFLRRILESNNLDKIQARDEKYFKSIYYCISEDNYLWIHLGEDCLSYNDKHICKDLELEEKERNEYLYFFNKIFEKKEEQSFNSLDKLCRYKGEIIDF